MAWLIISAAVFFGFISLAIAWASERKLNLEESRGWRFRSTSEGVCYEEKRDDGWTGILLQRVEVAPGQYIFRLPSAKELPGVPDWLAGREEEILARMRSVRVFLRLDRT